MIVHNGLRRGQRSASHGGDPIAGKRYKSDEGVPNDAGSVEALRAVQRELDKEARRIDKLIQDKRRNHAD